MLKESSPIHKQLGKQVLNDMSASLDKGIFIILFVSLTSFKFIIYLKVTQNVNFNN